MEKLERQKVCGVSWLHSKQTTNSLEKLRLFEEYYRGMDKKLRRRVVEYVKNNRTQLGKLLYTTKNCYIDDMDFNEFITSIIECVGKEKLSEALIKSIKIILKKDRSLKKDFSEKDIEKAIKIYMYYTTYIGYAFEQRVRDLIKNNDDYEVYTSEVLDRKYAIDMQVYSLSRKKVIGLQLKTFTFFNISTNKRKEYSYKNSQGIFEKWYEDVFYVFHDYECNIISNDFNSVMNYKEACNTNEKYFMVEDNESFLNDLERAFGKVEKC